MNKQTIDDLDLKGKRVLVRVDFNVPLTDGKQVADDKRIKAALPTIQKVINDSGKAILMSHLGRPDGKPNPDYSLAPVAKRLGELLGVTVAFAPDCVGEEVEKMVADMQNGDVLLLENLRFHPEEEGKKDGEKMSKTDRQWFIDGLAQLADVYVDDAFGTAHRAHASMAGVPEKLGQGAAGYLLQKELDYFSKVFENPERPLLAILGGAKVSDKIMVINNLLDKVDSLIIGGAMAYTFLKARGVPVGTSRVEEDFVDKAKEYLAKAQEKGVTLLLPVDHIVAAEFPSGDAAEGEVTKSDSIPDGKMGLDIGPKTLDLYISHVKKAKTIIWNGPMGVFEVKGFDRGTYGLAEAIAQCDAVSVVGGGDSASAAKKSGYGDKFGHISTGGGASLELMEGKILPGVAALTEKSA
ncbi:phosphoglycerate kinase [candidate division KSB1 bacterium]|nr:phosphoglycerate kinase [candidate division KSB1 bacterium]RQW03745.1 MAG: phosphoglycerate kinase [candidate division KSB1 bacterium]